MIDPEDIVGPEWAEWYRMTPQERWEASARLWADYLALGGSLDPEPDSDSPFFDPDEQSSTQQQHFIGIESCSRSLALVKPELLQIAERLAQAAPDLDIRSDQCDLIRIYFHGRSTVVTVAAINGGYEGRALLITPDILEANRPVAYLKFDGLAGVSQLAQWVRSIRSTCD